MGAPGHDVTELLRAWGDGDLDARDRLVPLVYQELRRRAAGYMRRERTGLAGGSRLALQDPVRTRR